MSPYIFIRSMIYKRKRAVPTIAIIAIVAKIANNVRVIVEKRVWMIPWMIISKGIAYAALMPS